MGEGQANISYAGLRGLLPSVEDENHTDLPLHRTFAFRVVEKKINVSIKYNFQIGPHFPFQLLLLLGNIQKWGWWRYFGSRG